MRSVATASKIILLTVITQDHARELAATHTGEAQTSVDSFVDKLIDKLFSRALVARHFQAAAQYTRAHSSRLAFEVQRSFVPAPIANSVDCTGLHGMDATGDVIVSRRATLGSVACMTLLSTQQRAQAEESLEMLSSENVEFVAKVAYKNRDFPGTLKALDVLVAREPDVPIWREERGQLYVDLKQFKEAIVDFDKAEQLWGPGYRSLGLLSNRALAWEGLYEWRKALKDYDESVRVAGESGQKQPYVLNSRGNCHASLGEWEQALDDYRESARLFQTSRGLAGAIYADSNAALMLAQLGREEEALTAMRSVARRAPGSIDMRAALAAMSWSRGEPEKAEEYWYWACEKINSGQLVPGGDVLDGCGQYRDADWLGRIRRWPPVMVKRMEAFLDLRRPSSLSAS